MRLKKLSLFGFKSFAQRTTLDFSAGITAIVGPNGCGKSNLVEALRWVLGMSNAKALRGSKMSDVLFSGTKTRRSAPFAEVSITFDDIDEALDLPYSELEVTRRLNPEGDSHYYINQKPVRLKEIHQLFAGTGMGKGGFWICEQGRLDQVIRISPQERRLIFEEAAGVSGFLLKKREALSRLKETTSNVERARERKDEQERLLEHLEVQAEEATNYQENQKRFTELEKSLFYLRHEKFSKDREQLKKNEETLKEKAEKVKEKFEGMNSRLKSAHEELAKSEERRHLALGKLNELVQLNQQNERESARLRQEAENLKQKSAHAVKEKKLIEESTESESKEKETLCCELNEISEELLKLEKEQQQIESALNEKQQSYQKLKIERGEAETHYFKALKAAHQESAKLKEIEIKLSNLKERQKRDEQETLELKGRRSEIESATLNQKSELEETTKHLEKKRWELDENRKDCQSTREIFNSSDASLRQIERELGSLEVRLHSLASLKREHEGLSKGCQALLQKGQQFGLTPLYEELKVDGAKLEALSSVLRPFTDALVYKEETDVAKIMALAIENNLFDFSLISSKYLEEITSSVELCDSFADALKNAQENPTADYWTKEQCWISKNHFISRMKKREHDPLFREKEIKELEAKIQKIKARRDEQKNQTAKLQIDLLNLTNKEQELASNLRKIELKEMELQLHIEREEKQLSQLKSREESLSQKMKEFTTQESQFQSDLETCEDQLSAAKEQEKQFEEQLNASKEFASAQEEKVKELQSELSKTSHAHRLLEQRSKEAEKKIALLEERERQRVDLLRRFEKEASERQKRAEEIEKEREALSQSKRELEEQEEERKNRFHEVMKEITVLRQTKESLDGEIQQVQEEKESLGGELTNLSVAKAENGYRLDSLVKELEEKYQLTIQNLTPPEEGSITSIEKELSPLKRLLQQSGSINFAAIEDYEKEKSHAEDLTSNLEELEKASEEVKEFIHELDKKSRERFITTFNAVSAHFAEHFQTLFEGGEARLRLIDAEDLLEAGVEIEVQPPGKQLKSLNLLSGGERCLTAIALMLALFKVNPAPLCLLDEVDAPLDETNVERFLRVIKPFSEKTQLVIVTHNRQTMAEAHLLTGVSMEEKGISKLLSLTFSEELALAGN